VREVPADHLVQLFDAPRSLADTVSRYLAEGWTRGDQLLVIARPRNWELIAGYLEGRGCPVRDTSAHERIHVIDAVQLLRRIRRRGAFDRGRAQQLLTSIVADAAAPARPLCVYGELVELLAEEGNFETAGVVEDVWNDLRASFTFRLLCGYLAAHFADPRTATSLRRICDKHTAVQTHSADSLGSWLTSFPVLG
jgi:hypothetical protein